MLNKGSTTELEPRLMTRELSETNVEILKKNIYEIIEDYTIEYTGNIREADVLIALQSKLKKNFRLQAAARSEGLPTYVIKTSSCGSYNEAGHIMKTVQGLMSDYVDGFEFYEPETKANDSEKWCFGGKGRK